MTEEHVEIIRERRYKSIKKIWKLFNDSKYYGEEKFQLSTPLVDKVIEHYIADVEILRIRYGITEDSHLQPHKRAGLMAAAILRHKPIIPLKEELKGSVDVYANETFAIFHGISICGGRISTYSECKEVSKKPWWGAWYNDFLYLLHNRNYTSESLMFMFETLSLFIFPEYLEEQFSSYPHIK